MAGRLVVTTLNNDTGVLATQNGMTGIAKAWCNVSGATPTINGSFNISSVTYSSGTYSFNFTTAMPSTAYAIAVGAQNATTNTNTANNTVPTSTTQAQVTHVENGSGTSAANLSIAIFI